jgi:hypothetical protein
MSAMATAKEDVLETVNGEVSNECDGRDPDADQEQRGCGVIKERHGRLDPIPGRNVQSGRFYLDGMGRSGNVAPPA